MNAAAHNEFICTSLGATDIIAPQTAIVHAIALTADDEALVWKDIAKVVWSPRSNISLYGNTASVTLLDALGVPIALGTDWMPSGLKLLEGCEPLQEDADADGHGDACDTCPEKNPGRRFARRP